jgi:hypothetical protein
MLFRCCGAESMKDRFTRGVYCTYLEIYKYGLWKLFMLVNLNITMVFASDIH